MEIHNICIITPDENPLASIVEENPNDTNEIPYKISDPIIELFGEDSNKRGSSRKG